MSADDNHFIRLFRPGNVCDDVVFGNWTFEPLHFGVELFAVFECGMLKMKCHVVDTLDEAGGQAEALGHGTLMSGPAVKRGVIAAVNPSLFAEWAAWVKTRS